MAVKLEREAVMEHQTRMELAEKAKNFLDSDGWKQIVKPILDSMLAGLKDATTIDISSPDSAAVEVKARTEAAKYIDTIQSLIEGYIIDGDQSRKVLFPAKKGLELFKVKD
jgi:hypothetical protein